MAPDGGDSIVLSGDGSTSNRLAATVAGQGSNQSAYRKGFKAYIQPLDENTKSGSKPQSVLVEDVTPEQFENFVAEGKKIVGEKLLRQHYRQARAGRPLGLPQPASL